MTLYQTQGGELVEAVVQSESCGVDESRASRRDSHRRRREDQAQRDRESIKDDGVIWRTTKSGHTIGIDPKEGDVEKGNPHHPAMGGGGGGDKGGWTSIMDPDTGKVTRDPAKVKEIIAKEKAAKTKAAADKEAADLSKAEKAKYEPIAAPSSADQKQLARHTKVYRKTLNALPMEKVNKLARMKSGKSVKIKGVAITKREKGSDHYFEISDGSTTKDVGVRGLGHSVAQLAADKAAGKHPHRIQTDTHDLNSPSRAGVSAKVWQDASRSGPGKKASDTQAHARTVATHANDKGLHQKLGLLRDLPDGRQFVHHGVRVTSKHGGVFVDDKYAGGHDEHAKIAKKIGTIIADHTHGTVSESAPFSHLHRLVEAREESMNRNTMTEARKLAGMRPVLPSLEEATQIYKIKGLTAKSMSDPSKVMRAVYEALPRWLKHKQPHGQVYMAHNDDVVIGTFRLTGQWHRDGSITTMLKRGGKVVSYAKRTTPEEALREYQSYLNTAINNYEASQFSGSDVEKAKFYAPGRGVMQRVGRTVTKAPIESVDEKELGRPEVIHGMKYGGTRYKFRHGIFIDEVHKTGEFRVSQSGRPTKLLGVAKSMKKAKEIALKKAEFLDYGSFPESVEDLTEAKTYKKGQMVDLRLGHPPKIETYKVLRYYPTKADAEGPFPTTLTRLIRKGGGALLVELQPGKKSMEKDGGIHTPGPRGGSWRPKEYIVYLDSEGNVDGAPVYLKPHQFKRVMSYKESVEQIDDLTEGMKGSPIGQHEVKVGMVVGATSEWNDKKGEAPAWKILKIGNGFVDVGLASKSGAWGRGYKAARYKWADGAYRRGGKKDPSMLVYPDPDYYKEDDMQEALGVPDLNKWKITQKGGKTFYTIKLHGKTVTVSEKGEPARSGLYRYRIFINGKQYQKQDETEIKGVMRTVQTAVMEGVEPIEEMDIMDAEEKVSGLLQKAEKASGSAKKRLLVTAASIMKKSGLAKERDWVQQFNMRAHGTGVSLTTKGTKPGPLQKEDAEDLSEMRTPTPEEGDKWFRILDKALKHYGLPADEHERKYRKNVDSDEFMLMHISQPKYGGEEANFKHRKSRNYLIVHADGKISIPKGGPFMKGAFPEHVEPEAVADGNVIITESVTRFRMLAGIAPLPRPMTEMRKKSLRRWIRDNRAEIDAAIKRVARNIRKLNDDDREEWVMNDEGLYNWARSEGVNV